MSREFSEADLKWLKRFKRVMKEAPSELFLFVGVDIVVYPERVMGEHRGGSVVDIHGESIETNIQYDGGDY